MSLPTMTGVGRATADPELRFAPSGTPVAKVNLAFNSRKKDQQGNWVDDQVFSSTAPPSTAWPKTSWRPSPRARR
jgi:single-stranded DNA-binding protein